MANIAAKTSSNIFYKARCDAATHNEQLSSREGAADIMSIDRGRLYRIESGIANPYPEEIHMMADLYNAPELRNFYCKNNCPLGCSVPTARIELLEQSGIKIFTSSAKLMRTSEALLKIVEDGKVDKDEQKEFEEIITLLKGLSESIQSLNLWSERNIRSE